MSEEDKAPMEGAGHVTEHGQRALEALRRLLELSSIKAEVELTEAADRIRLDVYPADPGDGELLVGRQGATLAAYQFIVNRIVYRTPGDHKPVSLDVAGFAERRTGSLEALAQRLAALVREKGVELRMLGMSPGDRRTVHMALAGMRGVKSFSEDEGIARRLVISPER